MDNYHFVLYRNNEIILEAAKEFNSLHDCFKELILMAEIELGYKKIGDISEEK